MHWRNTPFRYGAVSGFLHWLVVALILVQFGLALYAETLGLGLEKLATLARHALAALRHHFVLRDQVLLRMLPGWKRK